MKKIFSKIFILLFTINSLFSLTYEELLSKAKSYEENKEWAYALGYYYDAMYAKHSGLEASEKFTEISESIKNGNPGIGTFSIFGIHDEWGNLVKNYYKYFTEFCPYEIIYDNKLRLGNLNYETRTGTLLLPYILLESEKYRRISVILQKGIKKAKKDDWKDFDYNGRYIFLPELKDTAPKNDSEKENWAIQTNKKLKDYYNETKIALSAPIWAYNYYDNPLHFAPTLKVEEPMRNNYGSYSAFNISSQYEYDDDNFYKKISFYDVIFSIYDKNGNLLSIGSFQNLGNVIYDNEGYIENIRIENDPLSNDEYFGRSYEQIKFDNSSSKSFYYFENLNENLLSLSENPDSYEIKLEELNLNYGIFSKATWKTESEKNSTIRKTIELMQNIPISVERVNVYKVDEKNKVFEEKVKSLQFSDYQSEWDYYEQFQNHPEYRGDK